MGLVAGYNSYCLYISEIYVLIFIIKYWKILKENVVGVKCFMNIKQNRRLRYKKYIIVWELANC